MYLQHPYNDLTSSDPRQLGRWEILGRLGSGGMGVVYLGRDGATYAAVKTIASQLSQSSEFRARFRREVMVSALVSGPQVAQLYDANPDAELPWLATRYVPGPTLEQVVKRSGPLSAPAVEAFAIASLEALRQIHDKGVTHRDLKPANVILTVETPVLVDFGIAQVVDGTTITAAHSTVGSAGWIAPEVLTGSAAGPASDLFSWGALVAFAASGRPPYGTGPADAVAYRVVHQDPDVSGLPAPLDTLVRRVLSRDPASRPTAVALQAALRAETGVTEPDGVASAIALTWPIATRSLALTSSITAVAPPGLPASSTSRRRILIALALIATGTLALVALLGREMLTPERENPTAKTSAIGSPTSPAAPTPTAVETPVVRQEDEVPTLTRTIRSAGGLDALLNFARSHVQELVVLDLSLEVASPQLIGIRNGGLDLSFDTGARCELCAVSFRVADLDLAPDARANATGSRAFLTGRFVVQSTDVGTGGYVQINLRAVAPGAGDEPGGADTDTSCGSEIGFPMYPGSPITSTSDSPVEAVRSVQDALNYLGYGCLDVDGFYGPATQLAVKKYQSARGVQPNGVVDQNVSDLLQQDVLSTSGEGDCGDDC